MEYDKNYIQKRPEKWAVHENQKEYYFVRHDTFHKGSERIRKEPESWVVQRFYNDKFQIIENKKYFDYKTIKGDFEI